MNKTKPLVSVLMGVFNQESYLDESIQSIQNQSYSHYEFIVVNDGSTDNSFDILTRYQIQDKRIRVISNEHNIGHPKSLNIGLEHCEGKYIARMDADDIALPERLEKQVNFMESNKQVGLCGTAIEYFGEADGVKIYPEDDFQLRMKLLSGNPFAHPTAMVRAELLDKYQLKYREDYVAAEDYLMWVKVSEVAKIHNLPEPLLKYRVHKSQLTATKTERQNKEKSETLSYLYDRIGFDSLRYSYADFIKILNNDYDFSYERLAKSHLLLLHAKQANDSSNYLPDKEFTTMILEKWKRMTHGSTRLGLPLFGLFYKSPLSQWRNLSHSFKVKFFIKCLLRH